MTFCDESEGGCGCSLTSSDYEAGFCTQCSSPIRKKGPRTVKGVKGILPTHGMSNSREYSSYNQMKQRVLNPGNNRYKDYGGRGISVCSRWLESFENFYRDMGPRPTGKSLERRDNNGNYEPGNCYWATPKEQQNNMRRNVRIKRNGKSLTIAQWSQKTGLNQVTIRARKRRGWTTAEIFSLDTRRVHKRPKQVLSVQRCKHCGERFQEKYYNQLFCAPRCQRKAQRKVYYQRHRA